MKIQMLKISLFVCLLTVVAAGKVIKGETKMPMLNWAGKSKVVNHRNDVPVFILARQHIKRQ